VISEAMARHYFGDRNPIGRRIWFPEDTDAPTTIVGVVKDFLVGGPREAVRRPGFTYFSYRDREAPRRLRMMTMVVRTAGDPVAMAVHIRRALQDPAVQLPVLRIDTADEQLADVLVQERLVANLSAVFGGLTVLLACLGLYGVISYTSARRTNEIGIRMALGATRGGVRRLILRDSLWMIAGGIALGLPAALVTTRLLSNRLFGIRAADPATIAAGIVVLAAVATLAGFLPAMRASRVDPMVALRRD
jgi:predicted lysophospholipase L1 biosynthesis ABC-type transport system permease subunit